MFKNLYLSADSPGEIAKEKAEYKSFNESRTSFSSYVALTLAFTAYTAAAVGKLIRSVVEKRTKGTFDLVIGFIITITLIFVWLVLYSKDFRRRGLRLNSCMSVLVR